MDSKSTSQQSTHCTTVSSDWKWSHEVLWLLKSLICITEQQTCSEVRAEEEEKRQSMRGWRGDREDLMTLTPGEGKVKYVVVREATGELKRNPDEGEEMSDEGKLRRWRLF